LRKQGVCGSKGPQGRSAFLARSQSPIVNRQAPSHANQTDNKFVAACEQIERLQRTDHKDANTEPLMGREGWEIFYRESS
jgi:hypothetical protein